MGKQVSKPATTDCVEAGRLFSTNETVVLETVVPPSTPTAPAGWLT